MYNTWISTYYVEYENDTQKGSSPNANAGGTARIKAAFNNVNDGSRTCSEAIGYGMILTSLMGDWEKFDKLHRYSKLYHYNNKKLMRWNVEGFSGGSGGSATDADIDILASLIIAYKKTGNNSYLEDAKEIGKSLSDSAIGDTKLLLPAVSSDGMFNATPRVHFYNISYMSLAAIKALSDYDKERNWNEILEASISYMQNVQNAGDGLWPDWSDVNGAPINPCNGSNECLENGSLTERGRCSSNRECNAGLNSYEAYYKETPRIPWRIAWYYHWYGDNRAKDMLNRGMSFLQNKEINSSNIQNMKHFYSYQGNKEGSRPSTTVSLSLCALGMGDPANQDWVTRCSDIATTNYETHVSSYYPSSLQLIYAILFNGGF
jgi:hypothetical protein